MPLSPPAPKEMLAYGLTPMLGRAGHNPHVEQSAKKTMKYAKAHELACKAMVLLVLAFSCLSEDDAVRPLHLGYFFT